jgi:ferritin-like metal-binding protein YciE
MANHETLNDLYLDQLRDLYSAERQILDALPDMEEAAKSTELRDAFLKHFEETKGQVGRLEQIFQALGEKPGGEKCEAIEGILKEGKKELKNWRDSRGELLDAALIAGGQRVEHYEMAAYGTARTLAERLGRTSDAALLQQTLDEEKNADRVLTKVSETLMPVGSVASATRSASASVASPR